MPVFIHASHIYISENNTYAEFTINLSKSSAQTISVSWDIDNGTASSYSDYDATRGTLLFAPGVTTHTIQVPLDNDSTVERLESLILQLHSASNAIIAREDSLATIVDNDTPASTMTPANLSVSDVTVDESAGLASFYLILDRAASDTFSVDYSTRNVTALAGSDYEASSGRVDFPAGSTVQRIDISITNDLISELDELFELQLSNLHGPAASDVVLADNIGTGRIGLNDTPSKAQPLIRVDPITVSEGDGVAEFVVQLSGPSTQTVSVDWQLDYGSSSSYNDYDFNSGTLYFAPGMTTHVVQVALKSDTTAEPVEAFLFELTGATNALIETTSRTATIVDDDRVADYLTPANLSVNDITVDESEGIATVYLTLDRVARQNFSVDFQTRSGSTDSGDFTAVAGTLSFAAGDSVQSIQIPITDDAAAEADELFYLDLSNITGPGANEVVLGNNSVTIMIGRSDTTAQAQPTIYAQSTWIGEADGVMEFLVQLSAPSAQTVKVDWDIDYGTASSYSDFDYNSGTLIFEPGVTTQTIQLVINDDNSSELSESVILQLDSPVNARLASDQWLGTIIDDDRVADSLTPANINVSDISVDEKAGVASFLITLDRATSNAFDVAYATADGSATAGHDYTAQSGSLSFAAGEMVKEVKVEITDDNTSEAAEWFSLILGEVGGSGSEQVTIADGTARAQIGLSDLPINTQPTLSIEHIMIGEGTGVASFSVQLNAPSSQTVTVAWETDYGTASSSDFDMNSGVLVFEPGVTTQTIEVAIEDDTTEESVESFLMTLHSASNALIKNNVAVATIIDNDAAADTIALANLSMDNVVIDETSGTATFYLRLDRAVEAPFSIQYQTSDGSAVAGEDYSAESGTVTFAAGQTVQTVTIEVANDSLTEHEEQFYLTTSQLSGIGSSSVVIGNNTATALIGRSDTTTQAQPVISTTTTKASEKDGYLEFVVKLNAPSTYRVTADWKLESSTASSYSDYDYSDGTLVFTPGVTTQTIRVPIKDDATAESSESLKLKLLSATNALIADAEVSGAIIDNDTQADSLSPANIVISDATIDESEGVATLFVTLDKATSSPFTLNYTTVDNSAKGGSDFRAVSGTLGFAAGDTVQAITIDITDDTLTEAQEQFFVNLSSPSGPGAVQVQIADASGTVSIGRSDVQVAQPHIETESITVYEGDGIAEFVVQLSTASSHTVAVEWNLSSISASSYSDYDYSSGTLTFAPGITTQTIQIALNDDTNIEGNESFQLNLFSPVNAILRDEEATAIATIIDNDIVNTTPITAAVSIGDITVNESTGEATFQIMLDKALADDLVIRYATRDGTAFAGEDYTATSGSLTFAAGDTIGSVTVNVIEDDISEADEYFELNLAALDGAASSNAFFSNDTGYVYIEGDVQPQLVDTDDNYWDAAIMDQHSNIIQPAEAQLYRAYYGAMGRLPDAEGFNWWLGEIQAGRHSLLSMAAGFIYSDEFKSLADTNSDGSISNPELITHIYQNVFGRAPDTGGFNWWVGQLDSGQTSQSQAFIDMTQSNEYVQLTLVAVADFQFLA
jgi:hypothetical protein